MKEIYKKNKLNILLLGILGFSFGILDWERSLVDIFYLQYDSKLLVSIITANIFTVRLIATLFSMKISNSTKPNYVFKNLILICALGSISVGILYELNLLILFTIVFLLETLVLEILSGYHYAYTNKSLDNENTMKTHSKRIAIFKVFDSLGIIFVGYIFSNIVDNVFIIITTISALIMLICIYFVNQIKNLRKDEMTYKNKLIHKLNIFNYSKYFRKVLYSKLIEQFALGSLIVLLSLVVIDKSLNVDVLKFVKGLDVLVSGLAFFFISYFIQKKKVVLSNIVIKIAIMLCILLIFVKPEYIFVIILLKGLSQPFSKMSEFELLNNDVSEESVAQKELLINFLAYFVKMIASYILLNINFNISLIIITILLILSAIMEINILYRLKLSKKT